jgi:hypothetical protein
MRRAQTLAGVSSVPARTLSKQELQYTGRSLRGANGTIAWPPQLPQIAAWNSLGPPTVLARFATARHDGHRCGSFSRPLLAKNACSPAEKVNSSEQSRQVSVRSWYTLSRASCCVAVTVGLDPRYGTRTSLALTGGQCAGHDPRSRNRDS